MTGQWDQLVPWEDPDPEPPSHNLYGKWLTLSGQRWLTERRRVAYFAKHPPGPVSEIDPCDPAFSIPWIKGPRWFGKWVIRVDTWRDNRYFRRLRRAGANRGTEVPR